MEKILRAPCIADLVELYLSGCGVTDADIFALASTPAGRLVRLKLANNAITNAGADALLKWPGLSHLAEISLYGNSIGPALERQIMEIVAGPTALAL